ncbi:MAG TPA: HAMP domain-containing sensor histidine kinase, partial [Bdellovibrionales bacterium]|nr:HAMP domain-containing sensor histidine kinase [Bdellovibrionales bacterium]
MRSLRFHLTLITLISLACLVWGGARFLKVYKAWDNANNELQRSLSIGDELQRARFANFNNEMLRRLQKTRSDVQPKERRDRMSSIIQSYSARDLETLNERIRDFLKAEKTFFAEKQEEIRGHQYEFLRSIAIALMGPTLGLLFILYVVRKRVLRPLDRLSRRMMDFLIDRYSFQFAEPERNELGDLQRTFNSLAQRVVNTMDELKTLDQAKSEFLSIASHELRTQMTSIKGSLSLLGSGVIGNMDPSCMQLIKIAEFETDRLIRLINDLLDLAKIEAGRLPLACHWVDWHESLNTTCAGLNGLAQSAEVSIQVDPFQKCEVHMDRDRVQQVLTNLISNAIKFSPKGTTVHVTTGRAANGALLVNVRDAGPG